MIPETRARDPRQAFIGVGLGLYATMVALAPSLKSKVTLSAPLIAIPLVWRILSVPNLWLTLFLLCALLTPPLPIALGNSGPHVALLFACAGLFVGLVRLPEWRFRADPVAISLLTLGAVMLASIGMALIHSGIDIAAASFARVLLFGIAVYVFLYVRDGPCSLDSQQPLRMIRVLFWAASATALFACVDFYFQFPAPAGFGPQFIWLPSGVFRRAQGVFYEASTLGNLCAFFLEMIAVSLFRPRDEQPLRRLAILTGGALLAAALVLSYSRASLINLGVALTVLLWMHRKRIRWGRLCAGAAIFGMGATVILSVVFPVFTGFYWQRVAAAFQYFSESPNSVLSGRLASWRLLLDFLIAHPWHAILGVGYKTLPYSDFIGTTAVADNTYLSLLLETGIIGLAAVAALNVAILACAYRATRSSDALRAFCGTWMFCFWAGQVVQMFSADLLTYWRVLPVYFVVLALAAREREDPIS
jgi:O-antigen ligase